MDEYGLTDAQKEAFDKALSENLLIDFLNEMGGEAIRLRISC